MGLFFLTPGRLQSPDFAIRPGAGFGRSTTLIPMTVGVLTGPGDEVVLVDAGYSRAELERPRKELGLLHSAITRIVGGPGDCVAAQLERMGIGADRVTAIVATHLHLDHIGGFVDFPNAEVIAPGVEFESGRKRGSLAGYIHIHRILRSGRARPVELDDVPHHGFPRYLDLFDDGRVVLLDARGHTAGSVCVLLTDPESGESALHCGDAAFSGAEYRLARFSRIMKQVGWDRDWVRASWRALRDFELTHPEIPVIPAHDPDVFDRLCHR